MNPRTLAALGVLLLISPSPARAQKADELPAGAHELRVGDRLQGWFFDGNLAASTSGEGERFALIDGFSNWVVRRRFFNEKEMTPTLAHQAASIGSFLKDTLDPSFEDALFQVLVFQADWRIQVNRINSAGRITQLVGRFQPTLSGRGDGRTPTVPGLTILGRVISDIGDKQTPFSVYEQHVGEQFLERPLPSTSFTGGAVQGYQVTRTETVYRCPRGAGRSISSKLEDCEKVPKEVVTVYSSPGIIGETANVLAGIYAPLYPRPFTTKHCERADLGDRFPTPPDRNQGQVGSCHIFAAVALLENGLKRSYGLDLPLSEQDLFNGIQNIQAGIVDGSPGLYYALKLVKGSPDLGEGGLTNVDLAYSKLAGVATRKTIPYTESKPGGPQDPIERAGKGLEEVLKRLPVVGSGAAAPAPVGPVAGKAVAGLGESERRILREAFRPFGLGHALFTPLDAGLTQRDYLTRELCAGRPVAVGMNVKGLAGFDGGKGGVLYNATHPAGHAFLITGFEEGTTGGSKRLVFKTRNSWGGINPEIEARELWRMNSAAVIDAPKASAPAGLRELAEAAQD